MDTTSWFPILGFLTAGMVAVIAVYILALRFSKVKLPLGDEIRKRKDASLAIGALLLVIALMGGAATEISSWVPSSGGGGGGGGGAAVCSPACGAGYTCISGTCQLAATSCNTETAPSITVRGAVIGNPSTAVAATATIAHRIKGTSSWASGVYGTAITAYAPGDVVEMELGNQTTTTGAYYTKHYEFTVPCQQTVPVAQDLGLEATAGNIATFYKNDQGTANTAITLGAGATKTGYITVTGEYQHSFGNAECGANSNVVAVYYNRSQIQSVRIGDWPEVACPGVVPNSAVANNVTKCFGAPVLTSDQTTGDVALTLQADAANNPNNTIVMIFFDSNRYRNTVTGIYACGAADNANADTGIASVVAPKLIIAIA